MAKPKLLINPTTIKVNRDTIIKVTIMVIIKATIIKVIIIKDELKDMVKVMVI